jgi:hypoxanthine-DNA glycosylase
VYGECPPEEYEGRCRFLLAHHVALWDVLESATRSGSLDGSIRNPRPNDLRTFLDSCPRLRFIGLNGTKATMLFGRYVSNLQNGIADLSTVALPSTSPANTIRVEEKVKRWKAFLRE